MTEPEVRKLNDPTAIPISGSETIHEYVGLVSNGMGSVSVAHIKVPSGWGEPWQQPEFDEITIVVRGQMLIEHDGGTLTVSQGEVVLAPANARVRYSNPFEHESEYWAVCSPAFNADVAGRDC